MLGRMDDSARDTDDASRGAALAAVIGERVRAARGAAGLSLGALAAEARIGKGSLSEIERGSRNPTLSTMYALARALGTPLSALLAERHGAEAASPGIVARLLDVSDDGDLTVEVFALSLDAGAEHRSDSHGPGVTEQVIVTRGRVRVGRVGADREIGVGEVAGFEGDAPHLYRAVGGPAAAVNVIRTPHRA